MKKSYFIIGIFLLTGQFAKAQNSNYLALEFKTFSEMIAQPKRLEASEKNQETILSIGYGIGIDLTYNIGQHIFLKAGINLINRRFKSRVTFNQAALFPEGTPVFHILLRTRNLSYQILEVHTGIGYNVLQHKKMTYAVYAELGGYKVLSANYNLHTNLYEDRYKKTDIFGISVLIGMQAKVNLNKNLTGLIGVEASMLNQIGYDKLIHGELLADGSGFNSKGRNVPHDFYRLTLGLQKKL